ncbi:MAG: hypothetical protein LBL52_04590 [Rickettsiales bacterium]|jgi:cell division protein FtsB|nr:hypothetical protein [Rickettsiales bacterium]
MRKSLVLLMVGFFAFLGAMSLLRISFGRYSLFALVNRRAEVAKLETQAAGKSMTRAALRAKAAALESDAAMPRDVLEAEAMRQLSRIPRGYRILAD